MPKQNEIKELSEILATALGSRPDLNKRLRSLLGARPPGSPGTEQKALSHAQRKQNVRDMFSAQYIKLQLKTTCQ